MNYWEGFMDWPLSKDWKCQICGSRGLTWGLTHGTCRCNVCHVEYRMRNKEDKVVDIPICRLKPEYEAPYKNIYTSTGKPIDKVTDAEWDEAGIKEKKKDQPK